VVRLDLVKLDSANSRTVPAHTPCDAACGAIESRETPVVDRKPACPSIQGKASEHPVERVNAPVRAPSPQFGLRVSGLPRHRSGMIQMRAHGQAGACAVRKFALESLTCGEPFKPEVAQHIASLVGSKVTAEGLLNAYRAALPGTHAIIDTPEIAPSKVTYRVRWLNNAGEELARLERDLIKDKDGSLELHRFGTWVDPSQRGRGLSAHIFTAETGLMKALSEHPRTRFTLVAGGSSKTQRSPEQVVGAYAWGNFGFDFAEYHGIDTFDGYGKLARWADDAKTTAHLSDVELLRTRFHSWVDDKVNSGELPNEPAFVSELKDTCKLWRHPWEISHFDVKGVSLDVDLGGRKVPCHIGKAFLTSGDAAFWKGAFLVNSSKTKGPSRTGHKVNASYVQETLSKATANDARRQTQLARDIESPTHVTRLAAVEKIGVEGGPEWTAALNKAKKGDPKLGPAVNEALRLIRGEGIIDANTAMAQDIDLELPLRVDAVERLRTLTGEWSLPLVRTFLQDDDVATRQTGLTLLERAFSNTGDNTLLDEVATSFGHSALLDEDDAEVRLRLVSILARAGTSGVELMGHLLAEDESFEALHGGLAALRTADSNQIDPKVLQATRETIELRLAALDEQEWD
jgi:hypothetical protein